MREFIYAIAGLAGSGVLTALAVLLPVQTFWRGVLWICAILLGFCAAWLLIDLLATGGLGMWVGLNHALWARALIGAVAGTIIWVGLTSFHRADVQMIPSGPSADVSVTGNAIAPSSPPKDRRLVQLSQLRQLYILSHDGISPELMAGLAWPPENWLNDELKKQSADFRVHVEGNKISIDGVPQNATPSAVSPQQPPVQKFIRDGLVKARADLVGLKKEELSCAALSAWQTRADATTRLAHANNIQIHNGISQHLGACQNITDTDLLDAIRTSILQLLDQGIRSAGG